MFLNSLRIGLVSIGFFLALCVISSPIFAATNPVNSQIFQDMNQIKKVIHSFLSQQAILSYENSVVTIGEVDNALRLPVCDDVKTFFPTGSRAWGKTSVGVRCDKPQVWTIYVQANVSIQSKYLVSNIPLRQGRAISINDIHQENGDLTQLSGAIFTEPSELVGKIVSINIPAGTIIKQEMVKSPLVIQQGQKVKVTVTGGGFLVSSEGVATHNAVEGEIVQVRLISKKMLSGIAQSGGSVIVEF